MATGLESSRNSSGCSPGNTGQRPGVSGEGFTLRGGQSWEGHPGLGGGGAAGPGSEGSLRQARAGQFGAPGLMPPSPPWWGRSPGPAAGLSERSPGPGSGLFGTTRQGGELPSQCCDLRAQASGTRTGRGRWSLRSHRAGESGRGGGERSARGEGGPAGPGAGTHLAGRLRVSRRLSRLQAPPTPAPPLGPEAARPPPPPRPTSPGAPGSPGCVRLCLPGFAPALGGQPPGRRAGGGLSSRRVPSPTAWLQAPWPPSLAPPARPLVSPCWGQK